MSGFRILQLLLLRYYRRDRLVSVLVLLGISLGVAGYVSIQLANDLAFRSFRQSAGRLLGSAAFSVSSEAGGIDENLVAELRGIPGVRAALPFASAELRLADSDRQTFKFIGIDVFAAPELGISIAGRGENGIIELLRGRNAVATPPDFAGGTEFSAWINGRKYQFNSVGDYLLPPGTGIDDRSLILDIAIFQEAFGTAGRVDSFEILAEPEVDPSELRRRIEAALPAGLAVQSSADRLYSAGRITEAFRINLQFLSIVSLFVTVLLIYNNASAAVLRRRSDFGALLCLGLTPRRLFKLLIIENLLLGIIGAGAGILLGLVFSGATSAAVLQTISNLYLPVAARPPGIDWSILLKALLIGPLTAVLGALLPLFEIYTIPLRETFGYQTVETRFRHKVRLFSAAGTVLILVSLLIAAHPTEALGPLYGFIPPTVLMFGCALLAPQLILAVIWLWSKLFLRQRPVETVLTADHLRRTLRRNSVAVASAMIALGMLWGLATMIRSFRDSVDQWISFITKADIYISSAALVRGGEGNGIDSQLLQSIQTLAGIADLDSVRTLELSGDYAGVRLIGTRFDLINKYRRLLPVSAEAAVNEPFVYISESFANRYHVIPGAMIELPAPGGKFSAAVRFVYLDYSSDRGVITLPESLFIEHYGERPRNAVSLYLNPNVSADDMIESIRRIDSDNTLTIRNGAELRSNTLMIFDQTFEITDILLAIALVIGLFAVVNAVYLSLAERQLELSILRAIGASRAALLRTIALEAFLLGLTAAAGGLLLGGGISAMLVFVVNRFFFGWSTGYSVPAAFILGGAAATVALATVLPLLPSLRFLARIDHWAVRYE